MKYILTAALAALITIDYASAGEYTQMAMLARFKGTCLSDHGKLKPADNNRWVCFLPNGSIRVST